MYFSRFHFLLLNCYYLFVFFFSWTIWLIHFEIYYLLLVHSFGFTTIEQELFESKLLKVFRKRCFPNIKILSKKSQLNQKWPAVASPELRAKGKRENEPKISHRIYMFGSSNILLSSTISLTFVYQCVESLILRSKTLDG